MVKIIRGSCQGREGGPGDRRGIYERERERVKNFGRKFVSKYSFLPVRVKGNWKVFRRSIRWQGWNISIYTYTYFSGLFPPFSNHFRWKFRMLSMQLPAFPQNLCLIIEYIYIYIYIYTGHIVRRTFISTS